MATSFNEIHRNYSTFNGSYSSKNTSKKLLKPILILKTKLKNFDSFSKLPPF
jgi:hypothetical protein